ncbi:MAG: 5-(carboxyamino)imidazole ribonucleotide mutase [Coprothermobacterota bacterium]|nr:5-(carboxyamino)imidazole ribonucleotide mutase [Coprothermobacterota bacterium]
MKVSFVLGSESDREFAEPGIKRIAQAGVDYEVVVHSAHRDLPGLLTYLDSLKGVKVIIAVAGLSAALPGIIAARVNIPVIGVPRAVGPLGGIDALISMVQMPKGVPVATMGIGEIGMINAAELALRILKLTAKRGEL